MKDPESGRSGDRRPLPIAGLDGSLAELRELRDATRQKALTISFVIAGATVLLAASVFHFGEVKIPELKKLMAEAGIPARL